jgi:hypothetical protein
MGVAGIATLMYSHGNITTLITMYSINIFLTFSLSQLGMVRYWLSHRRGEKIAYGLTINGFALVLCVGLLAGALYFKAEHGGWVTVVVTTLVVLMCFWIRSYYRQAQRSLKRLDDLLPALQSTHRHEPPPVDPQKPTAVLFVGGYSGLGIHALLTIQRLFPGHFKNVVFVSVGVIDAAVMKGVEEVDKLREQTRESLQRYVDIARSLGLPSDFRMTIGTEAVEAGDNVANEIAREFPRAIFFLGNLVFQKERWFHRILHNQTAFRMQRRLQFAGLNAMVLPVRVLEESRPA